LAGANRPGFITGTGQFIFAKLTYPRAFVENPVHQPKPTQVKDVPFHGIMGEKYLDN
jgi:hypothetical protein